MVSSSTTIGASSEPLNVSPTCAVSESTESIIRTATRVPEGTVTCRGGGGSTRSGFTSSTGAAGTATLGATGAGSVSVPDVAVGAFAVEAGAEPGTLADGTGATLWTG